MDQVSTMHKYILGAAPDKQTAIIRPFDKDGRIVGDWREYNAGIVYLAEEVDPQLKIERGKGLILGMILGMALILFLHIVTS
jgi:hypothetical protein